MGRAGGWSRGNVWRGMRSGVRLFRTSPGVAFSAVLALGMGIGVSTTMFSIVHGGTRGLPFANADRIVALEKAAPQAGDDPAERPFDYDAWSHATSFSVLAAYQTFSANLSHPGSAPERISGATLSVNTLDVVGVRPFRGRAFAPEDARPGADPVVLLSYELWQRRFGGDDTLIGRTIQLDNAPRRVIGVMPPRFLFPIRAALWTPLVLDGQTWAPGAGPALQVFGLLRPGVSDRAAEAELAAIHQRLAESLPATHAGTTVSVIGFTEVETPRDVIRGLYLLLLAATGVLLIACANIATLFIARAAARARDVAVQLALGASRGALIAERIAESAVISTVAGALGLAMAATATRIFRDNTSHIIEAFWVDFRVDGAVIAYAVLLSAIGAAGAALVPAWRAGRTDIVETLRDGAHGASALRIGRLSRGLVTTQLAFAGGVIAMTLVLTRSAALLHAQSWPFDAAAVLSADVGLTQAQLNDVSGRQRLIAELTRSLQAMPASTAALTSALPGKGAGSWDVTIDAAPVAGRASPTTNFAMVTPGFFDVLGARALRGRLLTWQDAPGAPLAAVVNQSFVAKFSPDRDPIGRRVFAGQRELIIVGVVADLMAGDLQDRQQDGVYGSMLQLRPYAVRVVARGPVDPLTLTPSVRAAVDRVDDTLPLAEVFTVREAALRDKKVLDVLGGLFGLFGAGALILTAIGTYSITAFVVGQRRREFGIRIALGATPRDVLGLVARQGGRQLALGLGLGVVLAILLAKGFAAAVEGVGPPTAVIVGGVLACLATTMSVALVGPARRAARTNPIDALRRD